MKNISDGKQFNYESCQALVPFTENKYRHTFEVEQFLSTGAMLLSTDEPINGDLEGFYWYDKSQGKNYVRANLNGSSGVVPGGRYSVFFTADPEPTNETQISIEQMVESSYCITDRPVRRMLGSWRMKFLGVPLLNRFYKTYGEQAFMMVSHEPLKVASLLNLDARRMLMLSNEVESLHTNWHKISFFLSHNLNMQEAELIVDIFNATVGAEKKLNPFMIMANRRMSKDLQNRFFKAMGIYEKIKIDLPSVLSDFLDAHMSKSGETAILLDSAILLASEAFTLSKSTVERTIHKMIEAGSASYRKLYGQETISMGRMMELDIMAAQCLAERVDDYFDHEKWVESFDISYTPEGKAIELMEEQKIAIQTSVSTPTTVITGGPGTGKTTTIKSLVIELKKLYPKGRIFMAAPTGKAARRMTEVTDQTCTTLHRMMGMTPDSSPILSSFNNDDTLILDECSLMDINLLTAAIKHAGKRGRVIFIGDRDQLESIDTGAILNDMILCRHMTVSELMRVRRQSENSDITSGAYRILEGLVPNFDGPGGDLHFIEANTPEEILLKIKQLVEVKIPGEFGIPRDQIQILASMRKNVAGVGNINDKLKASFNQSSLLTNTVSRALGNQIYHVGDRVMQLQNRYDLDIQNGEVGTIIDFDELKKKVVLDMGDRTVLLPYDNYAFMQHSWAMTVHKSQGSEFQCVIMSMPSDHQYNLHRKMLFTAISRGKLQVFLVGSKETLELAVKNGRMDNGQITKNSGNNNRMTHLPFLLAEAICAKSNHKPLQLIANSSRAIHKPKPVYMIDTDSIDVPF